MLYVVHLTWRPEQTIPTLCDLAEVHFKLAYLFNPGGSVPLRSLIFNSLSRKWPAWRWRPGLFTRLTAGWELNLCSYNVDNGLRTPQRSQNDFSFLFLFFFFICFDCGSVSNAQSEWDRVVQGDKREHVQRVTFESDKVDQGFLKGPGHTVPGKMSKCERNLRSSEMSWNTILFFTNLWVNKWHEGHLEEWNTCFFVCLYVLGSTVTVKRKKARSRKVNQPVKRLAGVPLLFFFFIFLVLLFLLQMRNSVHPSPVVVCNISVFLFSVKSSFASMLCVALEVKEKQVEISTVLVFNNILGTHGWRFIFLF